MERSVLRVARLWWLGRRTFFHRTAEGTPIFSTILTRITDSDGAEGWGGADFILVIHSGAAMDMDMATVGDTDFTAAASAAITARI
jgi:L-alanine-DL-glutamate epimerase-like enolase superfamily enzyme